MIEENKDIKEIPKEINEAYLNSVNYGDLRETFTKIGVPKAWKPGKKKEWLVKEALGQLAILKQVKESGVDESRIDAEVQNKREAQLKSVALKKAEQEVKKVRQNIIRNKDLEKSIREKDFSYDVLLKLKENIDQNLKMNLKGQRDILLEKRAVLNKLIAEKK